MSAQDAKSALHQLGFTALESDIYTFLVGESPATGYRIAQAIQKPAANVYKALETLAQKGAVQIKPGKTKSFHAIPFSKVLDNIEKEFKNTKAVAERALSKLESAPVAGTLSLIENETQLVSLAKTLIASAESSVVLICSSDYQQILSGLPAFAWSMSPFESEFGTALVVPEEAFEPQTLLLSVDRQSGISFTGGSGIYAQDHPLASTWHQSIVCQMGLFQIDRALESDQSRKQMSRMIENLP